MSEKNILDNFKKDAMIIFKSKEKVNFSVSFQPVLFWNRRVKSKEIELYDKYIVNLYSKRYLN